MPPKITKPGEKSDYVNNFEALHTFLTSASELIQVIDIETLKPLYTNKSLLDMLGYSEEQIIKLGDAWPEVVIHPLDHKILDTHLYNLKKTEVGDNTRIVYLAKHADGTWHTIESINTVLNSLGQGMSSKAVGITRDLTPATSSLTAQIAKAASLEHRCKNCRKLLGVEHVASAKVEVKCNRCGEINSLFKHDFINLTKHIQEKVFITNAEGTIVFINDVVLKMNGLNPSAVIGKNPSIWGKNMSDKFYKDMYQKILAEKKPKFVSIKNTAADGTLYNAQVEISPLLNEHGEVAFFLGVERAIY